MAKEKLSGRPDRRSRGSIGVALVLQYRMNNGETGVGETITIGGDHVLIRSDRRPPQGEVIEIDINWPVLARGRDPVVLRLQGLVVDNDPGACWISIAKHEFVVGSGPPYSTSRITHFK